MDTRGRGRVHSPRGVRQAASRFQSPVRRGRGRLPYSEEDVYTQASPQDSIRELSFEESGGSLESEDSSFPHRDRGRRHQDGQDEQSHRLLHLEQSQSPCTAVSLKDSRVNFRLGSEGLQVTDSYRVNTPSSTPPVSPSDAPSLPMHFVHQALFREKAAKAECLKRFQLAETQLEVFARHSLEYMVRHGQSVLPS